MLTRVNSLIFSQIFFFWIELGSSRNHDGIGASCWNQLMTPDSSSNASRHSSQVQTLSNLQLTPIERFWWAESVPGNTLSFFHKYLLEHEVDKQRIIEAMQYVAQRHPLPFCQITETSNGHYVWEVSCFEPSQLINSRSPEPHESAPKININREPGIRIWYTDNTIWFEYHHICADGLGALQLERDFFRRYAHDQPAVIDDQDDSEGNLDYWARLQHRSRTRITLRGALWRSSFGCLYAWRGFSDNVLPFPGAMPSRADPVAINFYSQRLTAPVTAALRQFVKKLGITLNDWILIQVALLIAERTPTRTVDQRVLRLVVPIDMRPAHGNPLTCANKMSFLYLDIPKSRVDASPAFFRWVSQRMQFLKKHMGLVVWRCLHFGPQRSVDLRAYLQCRENMMSCYVSNLGVVDDMPDLVKGFEATPALWRQDTPFALMAYTFRGQLHLTAGYDRARVDPMMAREFVEQLVEKLGVFE